MNRTNEIPSGDLKPQKPKPTQALLKQTNEAIKMAVQNIVPVSEVPTLSNEVVTVTTSESENVPTPIVAPTPENGVNLNVSNTQEVTTTELEKKPEIQVSQPNIVPSASITTTPPKIVQSNAQFVQVKAPTTTSSRVQSPNVKNFFIRKGIDKNPPNQPQILSTPTGTFIATSQSTPISQMSQVTQMSANKKIIIKSQQILVPASNLKQNTSQTHQIMQVSGQSSISGTSTPIAINANVIESSSSSDLSGILDLPILFADNSEGAVQIAQSGQILNTSSTSNIALLNTSGGRNTPIGSSANIFISSPDGKLPNRPVVISAAKITKPLSTVATTPSTNKVIFINRNQIKQQIVGSQAMTGTPIVKGLQTLKLMPTSLANTSSSTPITLQANQLTKFTPGAKIDLSQLKLLKNNSPHVQSGMMKPLIINKSIPTKNAIVIKSPSVTNVMQAHPVIKGNVLNKNITVRKVMNVMPGVKSFPTTPIGTPVATPTATPTPTPVATPAASPITVPSTNASPIKSPTKTTNVVTSNTLPVSSSTTPKTTRKTRNSN